MAEPKVITELTPEQEVMLQEHFKEHAKIGVCTERADRPAAEGAINRMYELAGQAKPVYHWFESPAAACVAYVQTANQGAIEAAMDKKLGELIERHFPVKRPVGRPKARV
jgi:hypothetical protein